jgi:hypothetical protein
MLRSIKILVITILLLGISCKEQSSSEVKEEAKDLTTKIVSPAGNQSSLPHLFSNGNKTLLSWVEKEGDSLIKFKYSEWNANKWQEPQDILQGTDWFVNWADYPMIAENNGNLWSHVLKKSTTGTYSYDVKQNVLPKDAKAWKTNLPLHTDGTPTEHGFVTVAPYKDGFFTTWLDGRNTEANEAGERGAMTIRSAEISPDGIVNNEYELDASTCDCCQTSAAITSNGPIVIYRDRSSEEIRDINIVRMVAGEWTQPKPVHTDDWKIKGCPVNGPKAAALENQLVVAWFTGAQEKPRVQLIFSSDGGANFDAPIHIAGDEVLGRVDVLLVDKDTALVSWMEMFDKKAQLKVARISRKGAMSKHHVIATIDASRKTGFPQMELVDNKVLFAWTEVSKSDTTIQTAFVAIDQF